MSEQPQLILASSSPRRKELLANLGLQFTVMPTGVDETVSLGLKPEQVVAEVGLRKTKFIVDQFPDAVVIGCDTMVEFHGQMYGKPANEQAAFEMLVTLRNKWHTVLSGLAVYDPVTRKYWQQVVTSRIKMRDYSDQEILDYIATGEPMDKAGSYGIATLGRYLIAEVEGSVENVGGLPVMELTEILKQIGFQDFFPRK